MRTHHQWLARIVQLALLAVILTAIMPVEAAATPTITGFTPTSGPVGTSVTITGTNFSATKASDTVKFNGTIATITSATTTRLVVTVPASATTGAIKVIVASQTATSSINFTVTLPPTITGFAPTSGPVGTLVTITGTNFSIGDLIFTNGFETCCGTDDTVMFNGTAASITSATATQLVASVPSGATTGKITVTVGGHTATSSTNFTVTISPVPTLTSFTPISGQLGTPVTIMGSNFDPLTTNNTVRFNGISAYVSTASASQITAIVPNGITTGPISVTVGGKSVTSASNFALDPVPTFVNISPQQGPVGTLVTINGSNFSSNPADDVVAFGEIDGTGTFSGTNATVIAATGTQLTVAVPGSAVQGLNFIQVTVGGYQIPPLCQNDQTFTVTAPGAPVIIGVTPQSGPAGTLLTITGSNFSAIAANNDVGIGPSGNVPATVTAASTNQLTVIVPDVLISDIPPYGADDSISITVNGQPAAGTVNFQVTDASAPVISSFSPSSGPVGTVITINGQNFSPILANNTVSFVGSGSETTIVQAASPTQLVVIVSTGAQTGPLDISVVGQTPVVSEGLFTVLLPPVITSFTPVSGPAVTTEVTFTGQNLLNTCTQIAFTGTAFKYADFTAGSYDYMVPATTVTGPIQATNPYGRSISAQSFNVVAPVISSFSPTSGPVGTLVTIQGSNLNVEESETVLFGSTDVIPASVGPTQMTATVPAGIPAGPVPVKIYSSSGVPTVTGPGSFTVTPPQISGFTPTSGTTGTVVTITGQGFDASDLVEFAQSPGFALAEINSASPTQLVVTVPPLVVTGPIQIVTAEGTATSSGSFDTGFELPVISSFSPSSGPPGTLVTINGSHFASSVATAEEVSFNDTAASINSTTTTQITAVVPDGATTGPIEVTIDTIPTLHGISSSNFTVIYPTPTISGFSPGSGPVGTTVVISGTGFDGNVASNNFITFNGIGALIYGASSTELVVSVPVGATTGPIQITNLGGTVASATQFVVTTGPIITSFSPISGLVGTTVLISGAGFSSTPADNTVSFNGVTAVVSAASTTQLTTTVPNGATTGPINVTVAGQSAVSGSSFTVIPPPLSITSFSPSNGTIGTSVTIHGTGFSATASSNTVTFHGLLATVTSATPTQIIAIVPIGATTGTIGVSVGGQSATSSTNFTVVATGSGTTTVALTSVSPEPSIVGQIYTVQAHVTPVSPMTTPTGSVTVGDSTQTCSFSLPATSCNLTGMHVGEVTLQAVYSGDTTFAQSQATTVEHIINPATPTEMCGLDPWATPDDPAGFVPLTQLSGIVYTPGITQDITGSGTFSVAVTSPSEGATTADSTVDVVGTFIGPTNTGITVNGIVAYTVNGQFLAAGVPLTAGANTLTVTATTLTGATAMTTVPVTQGGTASSPLSFTVDSSTGASGYTPMTITFDYAIGALPAGASVQSVAIDTNGDGIYDYTATSLAGLPASFIYSQPGQYTAAFKVVDTNNITYLAYRTVLIQNLAAQRYMLCDIYAYLKSRLNAQDATGAASAYQSLVQSQYQSLFMALGTNMPAAGAMLGYISNGLVGQGYADMTLVRDNADQTRNGYPLRITQGSDGVWRISEM